ncbi:MAG TPA: DUF4159 domain-containing protein [Terriglobales bacterium]|nr:DUF4159 domain-containing protein [Terriglobales bacterium]
MLILGALSFTSPWVLAALASLPVLWLLLRLTPPSPKRIRFPAIRLLLGLKPREETPHRTPWWLVLLRLTIAALAILALAQPLWNAANEAGARRDLVLVLDDGWASAANWQEHQSIALELIADTDRRGGKVTLLATAPQADGSPIAPRLMSAGDARAVVAGLTPQPWVVDRKTATTLLNNLNAAGDSEIVWLSDGVAVGSAENESDFVTALNHLGKPRILAPEAGQLPVIQLPARRDTDGITATVMRATVGAAQKVILRAQDRDGHGLGSTEVTFAADQQKATGRLVLPLELRNRVSMIAMEGQSSAGNVMLLDDGGGHKPVGIISDSPQQGEQPLLGELYYLRRALAPDNDVRVGDLSTLLAQPISLLLLPDVSAIGADDHKKLLDWVNRGGTLVRFAGPRLAAEDADDLLPVRLRRGDRAIGGALSWSKPLQLNEFPANSPFAGLTPPTDTNVARQVLAEPDIDLGNKTWARLTDGTPLVTGTQHGKGYLVLFHTSANADWSNLALSGLFVQMLDRLVLTSEGVVASDDKDARPLPPVATLDGFGHLQPASAAAQPVLSTELGKTVAGPHHPPGFYGPANGRRALNLTAAMTGILPLQSATEPLRHQTVLDLKPWLLLLASLLLIFDQLIALALRGLLRPRWASVALFLIVGAAALLHGQPSAIAAESDDSRIVPLIQTAHLGYVETGVPDVDQTSKAGLNGLTEILLERTAADVGEPIGVDLETDDLTFFPILYWPITASQAAPSAAAVAKINRYLANGGLILFDTADQNINGMSADQQSPADMRLQELTAGINIPPMHLIPADHVLSRAFYLLKDFPGRWIGSPLWVEIGRDDVNDGVASVIVGGNDYAAAWAVDGSGQPLYPVTPGGERQREMAYRFGVNLVMYALTGNYKSDQVHVPAILERLGQ